MAKAERPNTKASREVFTERASRWLRNLNIATAVGAGALALAAPPVAAGALSLWAGINIAQAGGFEWARRHAQKNRQQKKS